MPSTKQNKESYFDWLLNDVINVGDDGYTKLYREMNTIRYSYRIAMDANREGDALELRGDYEYYNHTSCDAPFQGSIASFLEFLISVIVRVDNDLGLQLTRAEWMHRFIQAMDLQSYTDSYFEAVGDVSEPIRLLIDRTMKRKYNADGSNGGLFVIKGCDKDLRRMQLFDQWTLFGNSNHDIPHKWD
nr:MAG TPA: hypothetical protein [Caudoviricetes sp.]